MASGNTSPHEWWKDNSDELQRRALLSTYRSSQRVERAAGWRRNVMFCVLAAAVPVLLRLVVTL